MGVAYSVLARKYRPRSFEELIGQDALVRTLRNAIQTGRIHQAYMLTGVRGVGKTTTARIIARALNCIGPDGKGGPTITPCGVCDPCRTIAADRNVDVIEMDAASNTGVDNMREIIDGVRYAPASSRYKLYIIDEVHMLSKNAFNALLKTLEEPPPHVKFVFATTEIRKVPVTVLSRCQRFDLRRVDHPTLAAHFTKIVGKEAATAEPEAIALIARAADGSVRDGLSLLDQAIALGSGQVTALQVRDMLGLADRNRIIDLFEATMTGRPADALAVVDDMHRCGADAMVILRDLLELTHFLTRARIVPGIGDDISIPEAERTRGLALANQLGMPVLTRAWQILIKGLSELQDAPVPIQALEMVVIRLAYVADLPNPGDLVRRIQEAGGVEAASRSSAKSGNIPSGNGGASASVSASGLAMASAAPAPTTALRAQTQEAPKVRLAAEPMSAQAMPRDFPSVVALFDANREAMLSAALRAQVHLIRFEAGHIELRPRDDAPANLPGKVGQLLSAWTGQRWVVSVSAAQGEPTLLESEKAAKSRTRSEAEANPTVQAVLAAFPGAKITEVRDLSQAAAVVPSLDPPEADDDGGGAPPDNPYFDAPPMMDADDFDGDL